MGQDTTLDDSSDSENRRSNAPELGFVLVVVWCAEPARVGEALVLDPRRRTSMTFGRAPGLDLVRQQPGHNAPTATFENPFLSRQHLTVVIDGEGLRIANVGRKPMFVNGRETAQAFVAPGDTVEIRGLVLFLCMKRPVLYPASSDDAAVAGTRFGEADGHGFVGESVNMWALRARVASVAGRNAHVLISGESGTGKELVAQALHDISSRRHRKLVTRNAATLPQGLIDAELFGNVANYPNAGMPERPGIIGEAHESTLFLDEIGELPIESQTHLLRVLDDGGEYQRLGDAKRRRADVRVVAATNRKPSDLKHDLLARLALRIDVPGLNDRREDIALIARHLLVRTSARDPALKARFFSDTGGPRLACDLVRALVSHTYTTHVRELDGLLWRAILASQGDTIELTDDVASQIITSPRSAAPMSAPAPTTTREVSATEIRNALARHAGIKERAWRDLGLPSRHALHRLMKKYGLDDGESEA